MTPPQYRALENLAKGRRSDHGLRGASERGGHASVMGALFRRGWVEWIPDKGHRITKEGRAALRSIVNP